MAIDPMESWRPLDVAPLTSGRVTRADEDAYRARHGIEPAQRMGIQAAAQSALSPLVATLFGMLRWGVGKAGPLRVILAITGGFLASFGFLVILVMVVALSIAAVIGPLLAVLELLAPSPDGFRPDMLLLVPFTALAFFLVWWWGGMFRRNQRRSVRRGVMVERLSGANGLAYTHRRHLRDERPGSLFTVGDPMGASTLVTRSEKPFFEMGTWTFNRSRDPRQRTWILENWGFAALRLPTPLPHILLDGRSGNGLLSSSLPDLSAPANAQRFALEGDFNRHFTLYCPAGYETDALYLFTPDVMARFVDRAARYDVEIVDDWLFLYSKDELAIDEPDDWRAMDEALRALAAKIDRWGRWRDDRRRLPVVADPESTESAVASLRPAPRGVATKGRRLAKSKPIAAIVLGIIATVVVGLILVARAVEFLADSGSLVSSIGALT
ncbi:hypothetical protein [Microbacterium suaedae]|uniref:hypothetical protein n=1 Tax=Microbacterium suaedae TaxID=2067813 RepID=UPI0013A6486D|nr:hypothetical protein [Microbacterium suaedae]